MITQEEIEDFRRIVAVMREEGVVRYRDGSLEIELGEAATPQQGPTEASPEPVIAPVDPMLDPDTFGGRMPVLPRYEKP